MVGFDKDEKEPQVADYVASAPLSKWLANQSFENFYDQLRQKSKELHCHIENLRDPDH